MFFPSTEKLHIFAVLQLYLWLFDILKEGMTVSSPMCFISLSVIILALHFMLNIFCSQYKITNIFRLQLQLSEGEVICVCFYN